MTPHSLHAPYRDTLGKKSEALRKRIECSNALNRDGVKISPAEKQFSASVAELFWLILLQQMWRLQEAPSSPPVSELGNVEVVCMELQMSLEVLMGEQDFRSQLPGLTVSSPRLDGLTHPVTGMAGEVKGSPESEPFAPGQNQIRMQHPGKMLVPKSNNPKETDWPVLSSFLQIRQLETPFPPMGKNEREIGQKNCSSRNPFLCITPSLGWGREDSCQQPALARQAHYVPAALEVDPTPRQAFRCWSLLWMTGFVSSTRSPLQQPSDETNAYTIENGGRRYSWHVRQQKWGVY